MGINDQSEGVALLVGWVDAKHLDLEGACCLRFALEEAAGGVELEPVWQRVASNQLGSVRYFGQSGREGLLVEGELEVVSILDSGKLISV